VSCPYLTSDFKLVNQRNNGTVTVHKVSVPACELGRPLDVTSWAKQCREIPPTGPCPIWAKLNGEQIDREFVQGLEVLS
jgi:hypothetical protein